MANQHTKKKAEAAKQAPVFWKNPIHIHELGLCKGLVTPEAKKAFEEMAVKTKSGAKLSNWVTDHDVEAEREKQARAKMRAHLGLSPE